MTVRNALVYVGGAIAALAYPPGALALVFSDPTPSNNGWYVKSGAAASVVTKDTVANGLYAGNPARLVRMLPTEAETGPASDPAQLAG